MPNEKKTPPKQAPHDEAKRILRRLQGEDGYDIFADRRAGDDRDRRLREYEDDRR